MSVAVIVPGYGGRFRIVERWRVGLALRTTRDRGGGRLVLSGSNGESQRMAALVPGGIRVVEEPTARSTFENVERSLRFVEDASQIAFATDRLHARRCTAHLKALRPELGGRVMDPSRIWWRDWWMDAAAAPYELLVRAKRLRDRRVR